MIPESLKNLIRGREKENKVDQQRIVIVDPFIDEETQKRRLIEEETRERIFKKIDEENEALRSTVEEIIMTILRQKKLMKVNIKLLDELSHYLQATKKQRGWSWETVQTAAERIAEQIKINESIFLTSPNYFYLSMQLVTEDLY